VTLAGPLPKIAIILAPSAFQHGRDSALATVRHEMEHAGHMQMLVDWLAKWRASAKGVTFPKWIAAQKDISKVDRALIEGNRPRGRTPRSSPTRRAS
jgi:hypothetical protein